MNILKKNSKGGFTLIEIIIVVGIIIGLYTWLAPSLQGVSSKQRDSQRIAVLNEYLVYFDSIKQSTGQYPTEVARSRMKAGNLKDILQNDFVPDATIAGKGYKYLFTFVNKDDSTGLYQDSGAWGVGGTATKTLSGLQKFLVELGDQGSYASIKAGPNDEGIIIFTSITGKQAVGCTKLYAPQEAAMQDGDGIPDTNTGNESHKNGNRILVKGDMGLWKKIQAEATTACQEDLPDPTQL